MKIVIISWPEDPDRGVEPYGPFDTEEERDIFVQKCQEAASLGYRLLDGALYLLTTLTEPFDPDALMQDGARCVPAAAWDWNVSSSPPSSEEEAWENRRTRRLNI